jgi:hypothetical protein
MYSLQKYNYNDNEYICIITKLLIFERTYNIFYRGNKKIFSEEIEMLKIGLIIPSDYMVPVWFQLLVNRIIDENIGRIIEVRTIPKSKTHHIDKNFFYNLDNFLFENSVKKGKRINFLKKNKLNLGRVPLFDGDNKSENTADLFLSLEKMQIIRDDNSNFGLWEYYIDDCNISDIYFGLRSVANESSISVKVMSRFESGNMLIVDARVKNARSFIITKNIIAEKLIELTIQALKRVMISGLDNYTKNEIYPTCLHKTNKLYCKIFINAILKTLNKKNMAETEWFLLLGKKGKSFPVNEAGLQYIYQDSSVFFADPFLFQHGDQTYLFVEEFHFSNSKGVIAVLKKNHDGEYIRIGTALERPYHLSYPFIFRYANEIYMIPETSQANTVDLYKCIDFPMKWENTKTILSNVKACDTTLLFHDNIWWMFTSIERNGWGYDEQLYLYYSDDPINGKWAEHLLNPIVMDTRYARMAGNIIIKEGKLIRPAQDCSKVYGDAINYMEIQTLTKEDYNEKIVFDTTPEKKYLGIHTYNEMDTEFIIDVRRYKK